MAEQNPRESISRITHICGGSEGCMCVYDADCNPDLKVTRYVLQVDAEALARAVSASLTHGERSPLEAALTVYLSKHPWSDL